MNVNGVKLVDIGTHEEDESFLLPDRRYCIDKTGNDGQEAYILLRRVYRDEWEEVVYGPSISSLVNDWVNMLR